MCHPELQSNPDLRLVSIKNLQLEHEGTRNHIIGPKGANAGSSMGGIAVIGDEIHVVAAAHLEKLNANVLVHQRDKGVSAEVAGVIQPVRAIGIVVAIGLTTILAALSLAIVKLYENRLARTNLKLEGMVRKRTQSLMNTRDAVVFGLAKLADSRDPDTGAHLERIHSYVTILASQLEKESSTIDDKFVDDLAIASSLHDIGKVGIPDQILLNPGALSPRERNIIQTHTVIGGDCLKEIQIKLGRDDFLGIAAEIAYCHHEKWNGTGYPSGLAGKDIPLSARIVALADVYDALTSARPYKKSFSHERAREIIVDGKGTHFDPDIVEAFLESEVEFMTISQGQAIELDTLESILEVRKELKNGRNKEGSPVELAQTINPPTSKK